MAGVVGEVAGVVGVVGVRARGGREEGMGVGEGEGIGWVRWGGGGLCWVVEVEVLIVLLTRRPFAWCATL